MKTPQDGLDEVLSYLQVPQLTDVLTGSVFENNERGNSKQEDVCLNALSMSDADRQQGVINVNVFVPDTKREINGEIVPVAHKERLKIIVNIIKVLLGEKRGKYFDGGNFWISNISGALQEKEIKQHKVNIRVEIRFNN